MRGAPPRRVLRSHTADLQADLRSAAFTSTAKCQNSRNPAQCQRTHRDVLAALISSLFQRSRSAFSIVSLSSSMAGEEFYTSMSQPIPTAIGFCINYAKRCRIHVAFDMRCSIGTPSSVAR